MLTTPWRPLLAWPVGEQVLGSTLHVETVITAGRSGATQPSWGTINPPAAGGTITDGSVVWIDQGSLTAVPPALWASGHAYALGERILDTNNNIEVVTIATGNSGGTEPVWPLGAGATITDGGVTWTNAGTTPAAGLAVTGGTTGVIIDNVVNSPGGASQVYFGTLADQACTTSGGTGGCAMQVSQLALQ